MNILTFDTSTSLEIIVLASGGKFYVRGDRGVSAHSSSLFQGIGSLLDQAGIKMSDVDCIGTGTGPGSFTGIRIGVAAGRMLAQIHNVPAAGILSTDIFAASMKKYVSEGSFILTAFDAKKKRVFGSLHLVKNGYLKTVVTAGDYEITQLAEKCDGHVLAIGDGAEKYRDQITAVWSDVAFAVPEPDGEAITQLVKDKLQEEGLHDFSTLLPFYARKSDAEEAFENRHSYA